MQNSMVMFTFSVLDRKQMFFKIGAVKNSEENIPRKATVLESVVNKVSNATLQSKRHYLFILTIL